MPAPDGGWITKPAGLDFGAVMLVAQGAGVDLPLLTAILPQIEAAIMAPPEPMEGDADADE